MAIAITLKEYLQKNNIDYDIMSHDYTNTSLATAHAAHIPANQLAKSVILEDDQGYIMAVIPATEHVKIGVLSHNINRHLGLATENEITQLFSDCDVGAIPAAGQAYNMDVVVDNKLENYPDVYFEAGDHTDVVHLRGKEFRRLMRRAAHADFSG